MSTPLAAIYFDREEVIAEIPRTETITLTKRTIELPFAGLPKGFSMAASVLRVHTVTLAGFSEFPELPPEAWTLVDLGAELKVSIFAKPGTYIMLPDGISRDHIASGRMIASGTEAKLVDAYMSIKNGRPGDCGAMVFTVSKLNTNIVFNSTAIFGGDGE